MPTTFPFQIAAAPEPVAPEYQFVIFADVGGLEDYYALFQHFGFGGTAASWTEHIETIIEEHQPALLDEIEFGMAARPSWCTPAARSPSMISWPACCRFSAPCRRCENT